MAGAALRFEFDLSQLGKLRDLLDRDFGDFREPLKRCGVVLMRSADLNFQQQGRPTRWQALSPVTQWLRRQGSGRGSNQILQDTGRLKMSVTWGILGGSPPPGAVYELTPTSLQIGTNLKYAAIQQRGGTIDAKKRSLARQVRSADGAPPGAMLRSYNGRVYILFGKSVRIPARPFLMLQDEDVRDFRDVFAGWVKSKFEALRGGA